MLQQEIAFYVEQVIYSILYAFGIWEWQMPYYLELLVPPLSEWGVDKCLWFNNNGVIFKNKEILLEHAHVVFQSLCQQSCLDELALFNAIINALDVHEIVGPYGCLRTIFLLVPVCVATLNNGGSYFGILRILNLLTFDLEEKKNGYLQQLSTKDILTLVLDHKNIANRDVIKQYDELVEMKNIENVKAWEILLASSPIFHFDFAKDLLWYMHMCNIGHTVYTSTSSNPLMTKGTICGLGFQSTVVTKKSKSKTPKSFLQRRRQRQKQRENSSPKQKEPKKDFLILLDDSKYKCLDQKQEVEVKDSTKDVVKEPMEHKCERKLTEKKSYNDQKESSHAPAFLPVVYQDLKFKKNTPIIANVSESHVNASKPRKPKNQLKTIKKINNTKVSVIKVKEVVIKKRKPMRHAHIGGFVLLFIFKVKKNLRQKKEDAKRRANDLFQSSCVATKSRNLMLQQKKTKTIKSNAFQKTQRRKKQAKKANKEKRSKRVVNNYFRLGCHMLRVLQWIKKIQSNTALCKKIKDYTIDKKTKESIFRLRLLRSLLDQFMIITSELFVGLCDTLFDRPDQSMAKAFVAYMDTYHEILVPSTATYTLDRNNILLKSKYMANGLLFYKTFYDWMQNEKSLEDYEAGIKSILDVVRLLFQEFYDLLSNLPVSNQSSGEQKNQSGEEETKNWISSKRRLHIESQFINEHCIKVINIWSCASSRLRQIVQAWWVTLKTKPKKNNVTLLDLISTIQADIVARSPPETKDITTTYHDV